MILILLAFVLIFLWYFPAHIFIIFEDKTVRSVNTRIKIVSANLSTFFFWKIRHHIRHSPWITFVFTQICFVIMVYWHLLATLYSLYHYIQGDNSFFVYGGRYLLHSTLYTWLRNFSSSTFFPTSSSAISVSPAFPFIPFFLIFYFKFLSSFSTILEYFKFFSSPIPTYNK